MSFSDFIFPKRCVICKKAGSYLCSNCFIKLSFDVKSLCLSCGHPSYNNLTHPRCKKKYTIDGCFSALVYNKTAQKLIYTFKYAPFLKDINKLLTELFYESIVQNENFIAQVSKDQNLFIPIPLYSTKLRKRGYNQAEILAKGLSKSFGIPVQNILKRIKDTRTQFKLSKKEREENIKSAFEILNPKSSILNQNVFLVDDIVTTGSTLKEAANLLKRNGAKRVFGLTLARD